MMRLALAALLGLCLAAPPADAQQALFATGFDRAIQKAVKLYWPLGPDWLWWKAQLYQESRLDPNARSPVGASGLAQFMPRTWIDIAPAIGIDPKLVPPIMVAPAIEAGAYYMGPVLSRQWQRWSGSRDVMETHRHAQAGYNAGSGHVLRAWRVCGRPATWERTRTCLPSITGRHAKETITYVDRIRRWRDALMVAR